MATVSKEHLVTVIIVGAGQRGTGYGRFALEFPQRMKVVAVAEPIAVKRDRLARLHAIERQYVFNDWKEAVKVEKMADCAFICTQDRMHVEPALAFGKLGYHLLLEKPVAPSLAECELLLSSLKHVMVCIGHVLRYLPANALIAEEIAKGSIGRVVSLIHTENIGYWHFAHSFVRGNWKKEKESNFLLLAKSCHDLDLIQFWMGNETKCEKIHSFGTLAHFKREERPKEAADNCLECPLKDSCPYSAKKIYLDPLAKGARPRWPATVVCDIEDGAQENYEARLVQKLLEGPYGRCVYKCDNDVVDHQSVTLQFENGAIASFVLTAFTRGIFRETRICGSKGEIRWDETEAEKPVVVVDFATGEERCIRPETVVERSGSSVGQSWGHGGADFFLLDSFIRGVALNEHERLRRDFEAGIQAHKLCFLAEQSRRQDGQVISLNN